MKPNYVPPPAYTVKGPELATDWEKANRPANITAGAAPLGKVEDILEERGRRYGPFKDHAMICQDLILSIEFWIKYKNKVLADDQKQALNVICDKIARIINGDENYVDNWDDIAGYATLVSKRLTEDAR